MCLAAERVDQRHAESAFALRNRPARQSNPVIGHDDLSTAVRQVPDLKTYDSAAPWKGVLQGVHRKLIND